MAKMRKVVLCVCVAAMCWGGAAAQFGRNKHNITRNMLQEMPEVIGHEPVRYSEPKVNYSGFVDSLHFDMRAMGLLYNCSHLVINVIAKKDAYPEGMVTVSDGHLNVKPLKENWRVLLVHYAGSTLVIVVAVLFIAVLPLAGLFWCCWYCCRMGRRRRPFDRKYDEWLKGVLSIILIGLLTLFLFGVVCAFATDSQVESGSAMAGPSWRKSIGDIQAFLNSTLAWTNWLLVDNYHEMQTSVNLQYRTLGMTASWKLGAFSRAASVTTLNQMVQDLDSVQLKLRTVHSLTATLRLKAEELNTGLRKVKNQLLQTLAKCDQPKCRTLQEKYKIGQLDTEIQYSQMPDVTDLLNNVTQLLDSGIKDDMAEGQKVLSDIQHGIQRSIDLRLPDVSQSLLGIGGNLKDLATQLVNRIKMANRKLGEYMKYIDKYEEFYEKYGPYRRYAALAANCSLLLITALLALGVLLGVCGARPDAYGGGGCHKGAGASCLLYGVGMIFLLGSLVTLVMLLHFALGVAATRFVCDPLTEPRDNRLFADLEKMVDLEQALFQEHTDPDFTITSCLVRCHANNTIYKTLHLWRLFKIKHLRTRLRTDLRLRSAEFQPLLPRASQPVHILRAGARDKLRQLADSGLSDFDFDRILSALETNLTSLALAPLAQQLQGTARSLAQPLWAAEAASLRRAAGELQALHDAVLRPMLDISARLDVTARELRDDLRYNRSSLREAIGNLMQDAIIGEAMLNNAARQYKGPYVTDEPDGVGGQDEHNRHNTSEQERPLPNDTGHDVISGKDKNVIDVIGGKDKNVVDVIGRKDNNILDVTNEQGKDAINKIDDIKTTVMDFVSDKVDTYLDSLEEMLLERVAHCGPLSQAYNNTRNMFCHNILLPWNGFWMSLCWCALLLLPLLPVALRLARLYRRAEPYPGPRLDAEYLYDAYADRDNVPLANGSKRSTLDIEGKIQEWRERSQPSAPPHEGAAGPVAATRLLLAGDDVVCQLVPPPALLDDLKTRLDQKDEDNESGIHESDAYKAEKRAARTGRAREGEGRGRASGEGASRDSTVAPSVDSYHARRYNDMAPKHWEEGPPRYLGSTEYERPPPYYYPGPHDRQ